MKELLEYLAKSIVEHTDVVRVEESVDETGFVTLRLFVDTSDMGKIIGKEGRVIKAIRSLVRVVAIKEGKKVNIELNELGGSTVPVQENAEAPADSSTA